MSDVAVIFLSISKLALILPVSLSTMAILFIGPYFLIEVLGLIFAPCGRGSSLYRNEYENQMQTRPLQDDSQGNLKSH
jgi:hypothetical protein